MPDLLNTASAWLDTVHGASVSTTVVYSRGAANTGSITATIGNGEFNSVNEDAVVLTHRSRDYLIAVADLELDGQAIEPMAGDRITEGTRTYEVLPIGDEPCARYSDDAYHRMWRIHTKLIRET